jgi:hypothetical protein
LVEGGIQFGSDAADDKLGGAKRVAPDTQNAPTGLTEQAVGISVASSVAGDFAVPVFPIGLRHTAMVATAVPEAAINEDGQTLAAE